MAFSLEEGNQKFNPARGLVEEIAHTPGYHTLVRDGDIVHPTRENLDYAFMLMTAGAADAALADVYFPRANAIVDLILALQDTDPTQATYGIWSWFVDEPLEKMSPPDWNWADFCGARLLEILRFHPEVIGADRAAKIREAIGHAAWSIFRRNVGPGYTNIAVMGAVVTAAVGEMLKEPRLLFYGRRRIEKFIEHTNFHGGFNEYNSPTYLPVVIGECERAERLCRDEKFLALIAQARESGWRMFAQHFYLPLFQWGGPQARAYADRLTPAQIDWIKERLAPDAPPAIACPAALRAELTAEKNTPEWAHHIYQRSDDGTPLRVGAVYRDAQICFGSINRDTFWTQRRPVLAYWRDGAGGAAVFRVRFMRDGTDFAAASSVNKQDGLHLLTAVAGEIGQGIEHPNFKVPPTPLYRGAEWVWRFSLDGADARVEAIAGRFIFRAGAQQMILIPNADCRFRGEAVTWQIGAADATGANGAVVWVDAIGHQGEEVELDLREANAFQLSAELVLQAAAR